MSSRLLFAALVLPLAACTGESDSQEPSAAGTTTRASPARIASPPQPPPRGVLVDCSWRSEATFPGAFKDPRNIVVGPLVLVEAASAARQSPARIRELAGWKSPLLVRAGHSVTMRIAESAGRFAALGYGPLPQGRTEVSEAHQAITFVACPRDEPTYASVQPTVGRLTFWSGGIVVNRAPVCVPLEFYVDEELTPRRLVVSLGAGSCKTP
jgi:hypothetical protein